MRRINLAAMAAFAMVSLFTAAQAPTTSGFQHIASYRALGGLMATAVAPGTHGAERIYASYLYDDNTFDVIAIDPDTGKADVFHNPVPGEFGARNLSVAPNGDVYFGTLPHAHFMRLDWASHRMIDLGRPSEKEEYIWDTAFGPDGRLYGVTYPQSRLVRYDPATKKMEDLGRMDPTEKYGRWIVNGNDGYLYMGIGTAKANIAVYDTRTGQMREVLPRDAQTVGTPQPYLGVDGKVYATLDKRLFALSGFTVREMDAQQKVAPRLRNTLHDGRIFNLGQQEGKLAVRDPKTDRQTILPLGYDGELLQIFRIGMGPDGTLFGSSILPAHLIHVDAAMHRVNNIGLLGGGELYSLLTHHGHIAMGAYAGLAPLMSYDPEKEFKPSPQGNPSFADFAGSDEHWRPQAMIPGPEDSVYVAGTAGYGQLEGPLVVWDGKSPQAQSYDVQVHNQSVVSLAVWQQQIVGGTTTSGGGGSHPTEKEACVFLWNPVTHTTAWKLVPVSGATQVTDLIASPSGMVYGIASGNGKHTLFTLDPSLQKIVSTQELPFHAVPYNGVAAAADGTIWGLADEGIFRIDDATHSLSLVARSPVTITAGLALDEHRLYFVSNSEVYRYDGVGHATK